MQKTLVFLNWADQNSAGKYSGFLHSSCQVISKALLTQICLPVVLGSWWVYETIKETDWWLTDNKSKHLKTWSFYAKKNQFLLWISCRQSCYQAFCDNLSWGVLKATYLTLHRLTLFVFGHIKSTGVRGDSSVVCWRCKQTKNLGLRCNFFVCLPLLPKRMASLYGIILKPLQVHCIENLLLCLFQAHFLECWRTPDQARSLLYHSVIDPALKKAGFHCYGRWPSDSHFGLSVLNVPERWMMMRGSGWPAYEFP